MRMRLEVITLSCAVLAACTAPAVADHEWESRWRRDCITITSNPDYLAGVVQTSPEFVPDSSSSRSDTLSIIVDGIALPIPIFRYSNHRFVPLDDRFSVLIEGEGQARVAITVQKKAVADNVLTFVSEIDRSLASRGETEAFGKRLTDQLLGGRATLVRLYSAALRSKNTSVDCNGEINFQARRDLYLRQIRDLIQPLEVSDDRPLVFLVRSKNYSGLVVNQFFAAPSLRRWIGYFESEHAYVTWTFFPGDAGPWQTSHIRTMFHWADRPGETPAFSPNVQNQVRVLERQLLNEK